MWNDVPAHERAHCENLAAQDKRRFGLELVQWQMEQEENRRVSNGASDAAEPNAPQEEPLQDFQDSSASNAQAGHQDASRNQGIGGRSNVKMDPRAEEPRYHKQVAVTEGHANSMPSVQHVPTMNVLHTPQGTFSWPTLEVRPIEAMEKYPEALMSTWTKRDFAHLKKALGMR